MRRRWASAFAVATAFFVASSVPDGIPRVRADELLARAERAQETRAANTLPLRQLYRSRMDHSDATCQTAAARWRLAAGGRNSGCEDIHRALLGMHWNADDPLSVHWYRQWHDSLAKRRDSLVRGELYSVVRTETSQGSIAAASLRVFSSDYRPVELRLELADSRAISVEAYNAPSAELSLPLVAAANGGKLLGAGESSSLDRTEVRAWQALHEAGADSGWDAAVSRTPTSVVVTSALSDLQRREKLRDLLRATAERNLEMQDVAANHATTAAIWPQRPAGGNSIPLAEEILEERFSDASERSRFVTDLSAASKRIVGLAFEHERLRARRAALRACPCSADLDALLRDSQARLGRELRAEGELISEVLGPLPPAAGHRNLSYLEAREMDAALESLFSSARDSSREQRDALLQTIRRFFSSRWSSP